MVAITKTKTSTEVKRRYNEKVYKRIVADIPKETAIRFKEKCEKTGISQSKVSRDGVEEFLGDSK